MEDEAEGEDIAGGAELLSLLAGDDLGGDVAGGAAPVEEVVFGLGVGSEAKVGDDGVEAVLAPEHDVFGFDVAVHDLVLVHLVEALGHAPHKRLDLLLGEAGHPLVDPAVELPVAQQLEDDVDGVLALENGLQLHDVGRLEGPQHFYLVQQHYLVVGVG